jgi:hypothetical protein
MESIGISFVRRAPEKRDFDAEDSHHNILTALFRSARRRMGGSSLFLRTTQDSTQLENVQRLHIKQAEARCTLTVLT